MWLVAACVVLSSISTATACVHETLPLELDSLQEYQLNPGCTQLFNLTQSALRGTQCDPVGGAGDHSFLEFELWDLTNQGNQQLDTRADPLLIAAQGMPVVGEYLETKKRWRIVTLKSRTPVTNAYADWPSYKLLRQYQHVLRPLTKQSSGDWFVSVGNIDLWLSKNLTYAVRARCVTEPQCPKQYSDKQTSPAVCGGHGTCEVLDPSCTSGDSCAVCNCDPDFADTGCTVPIIQLGNEESYSPLEPLVPRAWMYYAIEVEENTKSLLVEMQRSRGDPVLVVKPFDSGYQVGSLPTLMDFDRYADKTRFAERVNTHYVHVSNISTTRYYIGVYNYNEILQEGAAYTIKAKWSTQSNPVRNLCPQDCSGNGDCTPGGVCVCHNGWGGDTCEFEAHFISYGDSIRGVLQPGQWVYYQLELQDTLADREYWHDGLFVSFGADDGHPVALAKHGAEPTLLSNDILFSWQKLSPGEQKFYVKGTELRPGKWILGVYNMDYYIHAPFNYFLAVDSASVNAEMLNPYWSIGVGVSASLFLCAVFSICRRILWQRHIARHGLPTDGSLRLPANHGVDPELINSFPSHPYKPPPEASDASDQGSDSEPTCTVCLCEYEEDEMIRKLPCGHEFHLKCIDMWLSQHSTCPICRASVLPHEEDAFDGNATNDTEPQHNGIEMLELGRQPSTGPTVSASETVSSRTVRQSLPSTSAARHSMESMPGTTSGILEVPEDADHPESSTMPLNAGIPSAALDSPRIRTGRRVSVVDRFTNLFRARGLAVRTSGSWTHS